MSHRVSSTPRPPRRVRGRRAFTLIELLVVIAIIAILIGILVPSLAAARNYARKGKDSTHVRAIAQGFTVWAGQHAGAFPRPSTLDKANATVKINPNSEAPLVKDNTGNILSLLIFHDLLDVRQTRSPVETNDNIVVDTEYEHDSAFLAESPETALWDPGFAGFPGESDSFSGVSTNGRRKGDRGEEFGHNSYATAFPFGDRLPAWSANFNAKTIIAGNRGPQYKFKDGDIWTLDSSNALSGGSNTLRLYGRDDSWAGHFAYGDGHVVFEQTPTPEGLRVAAIGATGSWNSGDSSFLDNAFVNEAEGGQRMGTWEATLDTRPDIGTNSFIRIWGNVASEIGSGEAVLQAVGRDGARGNFID